MYDFVYAILAGIISNNISEIYKIYQNKLANLHGQFKLRIKFEIEFGLK